METKGKDKDRKGEGTKNMKPCGCTWHRRKRLLVEARRALPLLEQLGSSEPQGKVGRKEGCRKRERVQLGQT